MPDALVSEQSLARTYDGGAYDDAYAAVEQYRRFLQICAANPDRGYTSIANTLEIPVGRARSWHNGKIPNVVSGLNTAHDHGWIDLEYTGPTFATLNQLVAAIYSAGSINTGNWQPKWSLNEDGLESPIVDALESAGVGYTEHESETDERGPVVRAARDGAVLGRVLATLGTPIGKKSTLEDFSLPWYLEDAPDSIRESFVSTYVRHRGFADVTSACIQINEQRPRSYRLELAALIESVADAPVRAGESTITISADAARALGTVR